ncbi:arylamine N-acetyltransferase [Legionella cincinnatiensis]|nr:arylamine N-acetyltransferase [Legionella cincinnatiensis]
MTINLQHYLLKIKTVYHPLEHLTTEEKIDYLKEIYFSHVKTFPYSNFKLREIAKQHPLNRSSLSFFSYQTLLSSKHDGYCFQSSELLYDALSQLGYEVSLCAARVLLGAAINAPEILALPPTHFIVTVTIDNKKFLLDPGLGSSAPRFPILITGINEPIVQNEDVFKFYPAGNVSVLEKKTSQGWLRLMQTDFTPLNEKNAQMNLLKLGFHPTPLAIRDTKTVVGIITEHGRKSLIWDAQSKQLKFSKQEGKEQIQKILSNFEEGSHLLAEEFGIHHISAAKLKIHCTETVLPKPIKPWTVNFPLDERELSEMQTNLKLS